MTLLLAGLFVVLAILGVPIAVSLGLGSSLALIITQKLPSAVAIHRMTTGMDSFILLAIPFFILAGNLMNTGGITRRIFRFANCLVGHIPGGLGHANVVASMIFAGMSGSAVADAGGLGAVEMKAMDEEGYDRPFSAAITVASSTIGPIIPPSIPMVVYGVMAEVSVGRLFLGGFIPGVLMGLALMVMVYFISIKRGYPRHGRISFREFFEALREAFLALLTPVIIVGGILAGIFTPTEAAVVAVLYALFLGLVVYRELSFRDLKRIFLESIVTTATVTFIISGAAAFAWLIAIEGVPQLVANAVISITQNRYIVLFLLNVLFLILGCFMEGLSAMVITIPVLMPLIKMVGIDPLHFGVVMVLNLMIGVATPPVGMSLFVVSRVANLKLETIFKAIIPFLWPLIIVLFLITYIPQLVLWLPRLILG